MEFRIFHYPLAAYSVVWETRRAFVRVATAISGGITFAQNRSAKYDGMRRSAFATGAVDFVLSAEGILHHQARR